MCTEIVIFNEVKYIRYPNSLRRSDRVYYKGRKPKQKSKTFLHRDIWEYHNGSIPKGCHIHHKDENPSNNDLSNLECKTHKQHREVHGFHDWINSEEGKEHIEKIRPLTKEWHSSPEGIEWHKQHAAKTFGKEARVMAKRKCDYCHKTYKADTLTRSRFCSNNCKSAYRRSLGKDRETRVCTICGNSFECNKYFTTATCSKSCGSKLREAKRRENKELKLNQ